MIPKYYDRFEPVFACRKMESRHCPAVYDSTCDDRPCARFESEDSDPWVPEVMDPRDGELIWMTPVSSVGRK